MYAVFFSFPKPKRYIGDEMRILHDVMIDRFLHIQVNFSYIFSMIQVNFTNTVLHSVARGVHAFKIMLFPY